MQMSFINPARSVVVGDDTGIGGHCLIFGHNSWLSQFEGYAVDFAPIEIGNSVSLAWRVLVLPGTKIGDGVVVGANSVVHGTIPPRSLAIGFPARVISKAPDFPKEVSDQGKAEIFRNIVGEMIPFFVASGLRCNQDGNRYQILTPTRGWWRRKSACWVLHVEDGGVREAVTRLSSGTVHVLLSLLEIPVDVRLSLDARGVMWIDIAKKERSRVSNDLGEEVAHFLKRYGVRTLRASPSSDSQG
jgi:hypothetical protein